MLELGGGIDWGPADRRGGLVKFYQSRQAVSHSARPFGQSSVLSHAKSSHRRFIYLEHPQHVYDRIN